MKISEVASSIILVPINSIARTEGAFKVYSRLPKVLDIAKSIQSGKKVYALQVDDLDKMKIKEPKKFKKLQRIFNIKDHQKYLLRDGHHRLTAYQLLKTKMVPVRVRN